jgi:hypothetical protein
MDSTDWVHLDRMLQLCKDFFGHSHDAVSMKFGETDLRNVSLGYPDEVSDPSNRIKACIFEI